MQDLKQEKDEKEFALEYIFHPNRVFPAIIAKHAIIALIIGRKTMN
jgi:hypothetical protein